MKQILHYEVLNIISGIFFKANKSQQRAKYINRMLRTNTLYLDNTWI